MACSCNRCCSGKTIRVIYSERVSVALVIQHAKRERHIVSVGPYIWPVWHYRIFLNYLINGMIFRKQSAEHNICVDFLYKLCLKHFSS